MTRTSSSRKETDTTTGAGTAARAWVESVMWKASYGLAVAGVKRFGPARPFL
jgi:hypothetical protein